MGDNNDKDVILKVSPKINGADEAPPTVISGVNTLEERHRPRIPQLQAVGRHHARR